MSDPWTVRLTEEMLRALEAHLFPGDHDEHGAVIGASVVETARGTRLLGRRLFPAVDGVHYVAGYRGYRMLTPGFVRECAIVCASEGLAYLAVHCHGGAGSVGFSTDDLASHERGYPALLDILNGPPVGALVFAREAAAGTLWRADGTRGELQEVVVAGGPIRRFRPGPAPKPAPTDDRYDRQARLFGDRGQTILGAQKVGVIGAGGVGSLIVEQLSRLGVHELVVIDPDRVEPSNLSRLVGARDLDALRALTDERMPQSVRLAGRRMCASKVHVARRVARQAQPGIRFRGLVRNVTAPGAATSLIDCDYLFLAADSMQARLLVNALVHQYLIPGIQVGAKVHVDPESGDVLQIFVPVRPLVPGRTCLWCNELISPAGLQDEATSEEQRARQRYIDEPEVTSPSVITLNGIAASAATTDFLLSVTGLASGGPVRWHKFFPIQARWVDEEPRRDLDCRECSGAGRLAAGDSKRLPVRQPRRRRFL